MTDPTNRKNPTAREDRAALTPAELRETLDLLAEAGQLKRVPRSGWSLAGIAPAESVADHVYRTAILGHALARMEGVDAARVVMMILYHDLSEARTNDAHKIAAGYFDTRGAQEKAVGELERSTLDLKREIATLLAEEFGRSTPEAIVAKDADRLECILQGREYYENGWTQAAEWFEDKRDILVTESARRLYDAMADDWHTARWRDGLKQSDRPKP